MNSSAHLNLDDAWPADGLGLPTIDAREWGPRLRFTAPARVAEEFYRAHADRLAPFLLYGSGDFHHLSALWLRRFAEPLVAVSFDNHPDWDVRPPRWCCGGWVNRALELPQVQKVSVWGCGNFECWWPGQAFGNRRAERAGTLEVHAWADDRPLAQQQRSGAIFRGTWREDFERFVGNLNGGNVYVTVDMDCLEASAAVTNWENGRFSPEDVVWALGKLHDATRIVGGDICGAYSPQKYARWKQGFVARLDHPRLPEPELSEARAVNRASFEKLWPVLAN
ncbi:MAG: hypothetical protein ABIR71_09260 [Chthoniobacterales bacterium]